MTPTLYRRGAQSVDVSYAVTESPLGWLLVAATTKGVCAVRLGDSAGELEAGLVRELPAAKLNPNNGDLGRWVEFLLEYLRGEQPHLDLPVDVRATAFQSRVWQALRAIPPGSTRTYSDVAAAIGQPRAVRAVGHACATNPVALIIPCHRVVREDGGLGGYRWGLDRKRKLLEQESHGARPPGQDELPGAAPSDAGHGEGQP
jgi:AraC family transcriptional regulator of adaptative response/methylated-DNA-[protein]-cysteine methyltransferase